MPSLHFAWALWSALVLVPAVRRPWVKALVALYPTATLFAIVVTGNHYILDAAGGAFAVAIGYGLAALMTRQRESSKLALQTDTRSPTPL
jgi:membrane-associated phospholipid phosphatase